MSDIFKEVDEELRQEHYAKLWKKYGSYLIGAAIAIVASTAGYNGWKEWRQARQSEYGGRFVTALSLTRQGQGEQALEVFAALARDANAGYATLASLQEAALLARTGDRAGAVAVLEALSRNSAADAVYRDVAVLMIAMQTLETSDPAAIQERLAPLLADDNPMRFSAMELSALAALRAGNRVEARELLGRIADDTAASPGLRARATEMLAALGG